MEKIIIFIIVVSLILATFGGYAYGFEQGVTFMIDTATNFVEIDIDTDMVGWAAFIYKNQIRQCYPPNYNASTYSNEGNTTQG